MKDFSGDFISLGSAFYVRFGAQAESADRNASASGTGEIKVGGRIVEYYLIGDVTVNNTKITVSNTIDGREITANGGSALEALLHFKANGDSASATYNVSSEIFADNFSTAANATTNFTNVFESNTSQQFLGTTTFANTTTLSGTTAITGSVSVVGTGSLTLAGVTTLDAAGTLAADADATINITGTWKGNKELVLADGALVFGENAIIDLSGLTADAGVYTIFSGVTSTSFGSLSNANVTGTDVAGYTFTFNEDGTISATLEAAIYEYAGGAIDWASEGTVFEAGEAAFKDNDFVDFLGDSEVTLTSAVTAGRVRVLEGNTVTLGNDGDAANILTSTNIQVGGTLVLEGDILSDDSLITGLTGGVAGTVAFDLGAGVSADYEQQLRGFTGAVEVHSGTLIFDEHDVSSTSDITSITVEAGAQLTIGAVSFDGEGPDFFLNGSEDDATQGATLSIFNTTVYNLITATGHVTIHNADAVLGINGGLAGSGTLYKTGNATMHFESNMTHSGILDIVEGQVNYGNAQATNITNDFEKIIIRTGATLRFTHAATSFKAMQLDGGTLHVFDMDANTARIGLLEVTQASTISVTWNNQWAIGELTGEADLSFATIGGGEPATFIIENVVDYDGTLNLNNNPGVYDLTLGTVNQGAGKDMSVTNFAESVRATDFVMLGEGSLTLATGMDAGSMHMQQSGTFTATAVLTDSFAQTGTGTTTLTSLSIRDNGMLQMTYNGTLDYGTLSLASNAKLRYGVGDNLLELNNANFTALASISLILFDVDNQSLLDGYSLGISSDVDEALISVFGLAADQYTLSVDGDFYKITLNAGAKVELDTWDINWSLDEVLKAPSTVVVKNDLTGDTLLNTIAEYVSGTTTSVILTGGSGRVFGGAANSDGVTTNSWISVTGGDWSLIAGGNRADFQGGGDNFTGNSHIEINQTAEDSSVDFIVGGNFTDGNSAIFTGDSYISVFTDTVKGSIIGGSTTGHSDTPTFNGDTNIFIYVPLTTSEDGLVIGVHGGGNLGSSYIIGGNAWGFNYGDGPTHNGDVNLTIDLTDYAGAAVDFAKNIYASSVLANNVDGKQVGNGEISITGNANVTFNQIISGGSLINTGGSIATFEGNTRLTINGNGSTFNSDNGVGIMGGDYNLSGGTSNRYGNIEIIVNGENSIFEDRIAASGEIVGGTAILDGLASITIDGGTYNDLVMGGFNQHAGEATSGDTMVTIDSGTFNSNLAGGGVHANGTHNRLGNSSVVINNGTFNSVYGGALGVGSAAAATPDVVNTAAGLSSVTINGGEIRNNVVGGSNIGATFAGIITAEGGASVTITGGTITGYIVGGHERTGGTAANTISMGDTLVDISGGTINGDVYAAGYLGETLADSKKSTTASSKVNIDSDVVFGDITISGGFGGAGAASGEVTGTSTLSFTGTGDYSNIANVNFEAFDTVEVVDAGTVVTFDKFADFDTALTKTGAGTLVIDAVSTTGKSFAVNEGTLKLATGSTLTSVSVASAATLDASIAGASINGNLTMTGGSVLNLGSNTTGLVIGTGKSLTLVDATANKITLDNGGAAIGASGLTLFTSISDQSLIDGITFDTKAGLTVAIASDYISMAGVDLDGYFLVYDDAGDKLVLTNQLAQSLRWDAEAVPGTDNFSDLSWLNVDGAHTSFTVNSTANFEDHGGTDPVTITVDGEFIATDFNISDDYIFDLDISTSGLEITGSLRVTAGVTQFDFAPTLNAVVVGSGATLNFDISIDDLSMESLSNSGTLSTTGALIINGLVTNGGDVSAASLELATGDNTFAELNITESVTSNGLLTLGGDSTIGTLSGNGSLSITDGGTLNLTNSATLITLTNKGTLDVDAALTITNGAAAGGILDVADDLTLSSTEGMNSSFDKLTVGGDVTSDALLTVGDGSTITGILSGGEFSSSGTVTLGGVANAGLRSLTVTSGSLTIASNILVGNGGFNNDGVVELTNGTGTWYNAQFLAATSNGGTLRANNVTLAGVSSFAELDATGTVTLSGLLTVGDGSMITTLAADAADDAFAATGNVTVTTVTGSLASLSNGTGTLTVESAVDTGSFSNTGTVDMGDQDLSVDTSVTAGGILTAGDVTLTGENTFTSIAASGTITADALTVGADSSAAALSNGMALVLNNDAEFTADNTTELELASLSGGNLVMTGANAGLKLNAASSAASLSLASDALTLGGALNLTNALTSKANSVLNLSVTYNPEMITPVISAASLGGASGLKLDITADSLANLGLDNNTTYTLINLDAALVDSFALGFKDGDSILAGSYTYTLGLSADKKQVIVSVDIAGNTWQGTGAWDSTGSNWTDGTEPSSTTPRGEAFFFDSDTAMRDVVVQGAKEVKEMQIAAGTGEYYGFSGDSITTQRLSVTSGSMNMTNDVMVEAGADYTGDTIVSANATLNVNGTATLTTDALDVKLDGQLNIATDATLNVNEKSFADNIVNEGLVSLNGIDHLITEMTGAGELELSANSNASIVDLTQQSLNIGANSVLTVDIEATIAGNIVNAGTLEASNAIVNITDQISDGGNINAGTLNVTGAGATMGDLTAGTINLSGSLLDGADALLNASSLNLLDGETTLNLKLDGLTSSTAIGDYNVIAFDNGLSWSDVTLDSETADAITALVGSGLDVIYNNDGGLGFTVEAATDRRWTVSNNYALTPGLENTDPNNRIEPIFNNIGTANSLSRYDILDSVKMVYVDVDFELNFTDLTLQDTDTDGLIVRNLTGGKTLTLTGKGSSGNAADISKATLENNSITKVNGLTLNDMRVDVTSVDENSHLTIGTLTLNNSAFNVLDGGRVKVDNLVQNGGVITVGSPASPFMTLSNTPVAGGSLTVGDAEVDSDIVILADSEYIVEGTMTATADATLDVDATGTVDVEKLVVNEGITLDVAGSGKTDIADTTIEKDAQLNVGSTSETQLGSVDMGENAILSVETGGTLTVDKLTGGASSQLQGDVSVAGGTFEGSYNGDVLITVRSGEETTLNMGSSLNVAGEADANITLVASVGNSSMTSLNTNKSQVTLEGIVLGGDATTEATQLTLSAASSMTDGSLTMSLDNSALQGIINGTTPTLSLFTDQAIAFNGVTITITQSDATASVLDLTGITKTTDIQLLDLGDSVTNSTASLAGLAFGAYFTNERIVNGIVVVDLNTNLYSSLGLTENGKAGIDMLNMAIFAVSPTESVTENALAAVLTDMNKFLSAGSKAGADKLGAAAAGATTTALGSAMAGDLGRQLSSIRNRTMSMGASHYVQFEEIEYNGWINAESNQNYLNDDGTASGHDAYSWGGTVGVDANISQSMTIGVAFTAMYGDVTSDVADTLSGELNTQYLTFFARSNVGRWSHSFIVTGGLADATTTRTLNTSSGSYQSTGDTTGYGMGMMYEVGYNIALNEEQTTVWQPVASIAFQHSSIDGYSEKGNNAALTVGEQTMSYATIAAGARLETVIGENAFNRAAVFSLRAMVKADMGDLASEADVRITEVGGATHTITGTERGFLGLELGTGVSIPVMGDTGTIFIDASVELRDQQNNVNASAGYSFSF